LVAKNKKLKYLFIPLFLSVGFNAIVSYSQLIGNDFLQPFLERFRLIADERYYYYHEREISLMGKVTFGIYSSPVVSGHMLMYVAVLSMIFQQRRINFFAIFLTLLLLIGSFATQERTGFYTAIAMILFLMYIKITLMNNSSKYFLIFLFIVGVLLFIPWFFNMLMEGESRYAEKGFDTTGRDVIYLESFNYFLDHPLLGGYYNYMESHTFPPHNVLLNSLVYSGVLGTFFIISIFVLQMKKIFSIIRNANKCNYGLLVISTAYISIILNGFTHNISIVNADINGWIIWGVINYSIYYRNKKSYLTT
jgi:O-antigen ligase